MNIEELKVKIQLDGVKEAIASIEKLTSLMNEVSDSLKRATEDIDNFADLLHESKER